MSPHLLTQIMALVTFSTQIDTIFSLYLIKEQIQEPTTRKVREPHSSGTKGNKESVQASKSKMKEITLIFMSFSHTLVELSSWIK